MKIVNEKSHSVQYNRDHSQMLSAARELAAARMRELHPDLAIHAEQLSVVDQGNVIFVEEPFSRVTVYVGIRFGGEV